MLDFLKDARFRTTTVIVFRIIVGCAFIFSGFVKIIDVYGSTYKIEDYLIAFAEASPWEWGKNFFEFFIPAAFIGAILQNAFEFLLGICLLFGANIRSTSFLTMLFMAVMLPLTLYISIANPVTDCGCFGDALIISNWATFWKNVVFSFMIVVVFLWRDYSPRLYTQRSEWAIAIYSGVFAILISIYCYQNLPIIDFRPYKIGTDIKKSMEIPEGAPADKYETILVYEKDGQQKEFTLNDYPQNDSSWIFVDSKNKLVEKGYEPPIHDFTIEDPEEGDITDEVINDPGYSFLFVSSRIEKASTDKRNEINAIYDFAQKNGYKFYALTASGLDSKELKEYIVEAGGAEYPFYNTDEITLKTIIRSNPGLLLIKDGIILNKWSNKNMPVFDKPLEESPLGQLQMPNNNKMVFYSIIAFIIPLLLILGIDHLIGLFKKGKKK